MENKTTEIRVTIEPVEFYTWYCPDCGTGPMKSQNKPIHEDDMLCRECDEKLHQRLKQEAGQRFVEHYQFLFNAQILGASPIWDYWHEFDVMDIDKLHIKGANGKLYTITADGPLYVNEESTNVTT